MSRATKKLERLDPTNLDDHDSTKKTQKPPISERFSDKRTKRPLQRRTIKKDESHDKIIAECREADFNRRMQMYLQLPQLRSKFNSIDQNELNTNLSAEAKLRRSSFAAQMGMALGSAAGGGGAVP